jgi:hypothetical protein
MLLNWSQARFFLQIKKIVRQERDFAGSTKKDKHKPEAFLSTISQIVSNEGLSSAIELGSDPSVPAHPNARIYTKHTSKTMSGRRFGNRSFPRPEPANYTSGIIQPSATIVDHDFSEEGLMFLCFDSFSDEDLDDPAMAYITSEIQVERSSDGPIKKNKLQNDLSDPDITYVIKEVFWKFKKKSARLSVDKNRRCVPSVISPTNTETSYNYSEVYPEEDFGDEPPNLGSRGVVHSSSTSLLGETKPSNTSQKQNGQSEGETRHARPDNGSVTTNVSVETSSKSKSFLSKSKHQKKGKKKKRGFNARANTSIASVKTFENISMYLKLSFGRYSEDNIHHLVMEYKIHEVNAVTSLVTNRESYAEVTPTIKDSYSKLDVAFSMTKQHVITLLSCRNYERPYLSVFLCWMYGDCVDYDSFESIFTGCDHTYFSTNVNIFGFFNGIFGHNSHFLGTFSSLRGVLYSDSHFIFSPISFYITRLGEGTCIQIRNYVNFERNNMYPSQRHNIIIKQCCYFIFNDQVAGSIEQSRDQQQGTIWSLTSVISQIIAPEESPSTVIVVKERSVQDRNVLDSIQPVEITKSVRQDCDFAGSDILNSKYYAFLSTISHIVTNDKFSSAIELGSNPSVPAHPKRGIYTKQTSMTASSKRFGNRGFPSSEPENSISGLILLSASIVDHYLSMDGLIALCFEGYSYDTHRYSNTTSVNDNYFLTQKLKATFDNGFTDAKLEDSHLAVKQAEVDAAAHDIKCNMRLKSKDVIEYKRIRPYMYSRDCVTGYSARNSSGYCMNLTPSYFGPYLVLSHLYLHLILPFISGWDDIRKYILAFHSGIQGCVVFSHPGSF